MIKRNKKKGVAGAWKAKVAHYARNGYVVDFDTGAVAHLVVFEKAYGRAPKGWHVHHINHLKTSNDASNLIALPPLVHSWAHQGTDCDSYYDRAALEKALERYKEAPSYAHEIVKILETMKPGEAASAHAYVSEYLKNRLNNVDELDKLEKKKLYPVTRTETEEMLEEMERIRKRQGANRGFSEKAREYNEILRAGPL